MAEYLARLVLIPGAFAMWIGRQHERWRQWYHAKWHCPRCCRTHDTFGAAFFCLCWRHR